LIRLLIDLIGYVSVELGRTESSLGGRYGRFRDVLIPDATICTLSPESVEDFPGFGDDHAGAKLHVVKSLASVAPFLGAGLDGIEKGLDPGDPIDGNMWELSEMELDERGIETLPRTLLEAVEAFEDDPITDRVLREELSREYAAFKKEEWWDYHHTVSD